MALKSNNCPFTDIVKLVKVTDTKDASGYDAQSVVTEREVYASFSIGVNRAEYYESMKAGVKLSATVEVWEVDYDGEQLLTHNGKSYNIGRVWPTGTGTLFMYLEEVTR